MLEDRIEQDLKSALLGGDAQRVGTLRLIKSSLLNLKVATGKRETGLTDDDVLPILAKEAKKRQESADMYVQAGDQTRADTELAEKKIIEDYLPDQLSEQEIAAKVDEVLATIDNPSPAIMVQVIGQVKGQLGASADGGVIARLVKEKLTQ